MARRRVTELPAGYNAYCVYIPDAMPNDKDKMKQSELLASLIQWGTMMGDNLLVADWDIGDRSYLDIISIADIRRFPSVLITDDNQPTEHSFKIIIDEPSVVNNIDILKDYLQRIVNDIFKGDNKEAIKDALKAKQDARIKSVFSPMKSFYNRLSTIKFSGYGFGAELGLKEE